MNIIASFRLVAATGALACSLAHAQTWSAVADHPSASGTRSLRGLALSDDEASIYGGFIQGSSTAGARRYSLSGSPPVGTAQEFFNVATQPFSSSSNHQAEAVATDDRGWVYVASIKDSTSGDNARIYICDTTFANSTMVPLADIDSPGSSTGETIGGIDIRRDGAVYQLYVTRFSSASYVERYVVGGATPATATLTHDPTFDGNGEFTVPGASFLRGIDVAADGTMFIASRDTDTVWRVSAALSAVTSASLSRAMDCAEHAGRVYVTTYDGASSLVAEFDATTLVATGTTFTATGPFPRGASSGYAGIDIDSIGRFYICDQIYASDSDRILVLEGAPVECALLLGGAPLSVGVGGDPSDLLLVTNLWAGWPVTIPTMPWLNVPNDPRLSGLNLYFQVLMFNPRVFPNDPLQMSNGLKVEIGGRPVRYGTGSGLDLWAPMSATIGAPFRPAFRITR